MEYYSFISTVDPIGGLISTFMGLIGRVLVAVGLYLMGKVLWLRLRRRYYYE